MRKTLAATAAALFLTLAPAAAHADGSDSPTPYAVTTEGVQLPDGDAFRDSGHVNTRFYGPEGGVLQSAGVHFEAKCIDRTDAECAGARHEHAQYIGRSFIPWSAFGITEGSEIRWVQVSHHSAHFGEGGQKPIPVTPKPQAGTETRQREYVGAWEETALCETAEVAQERWTYRLTEERTQTVSWDPSSQGWDTTWSDWTVASDEKVEKVAEQTVRMTDDMIASMCGMPPTGAPLKGAAVVAGLTVLAGAGMVAARRKAATR